MDIIFYGLGLQYVHLHYTLYGFIDQKSGQNVRKINRKANKIKANSTKHYQFFPSNVVARYHS